jgi:hypothetical protein
MECLSSRLDARRPKQLRVCLGPFVFCNFDNNIWLAQQRISHSCHVVCVRACRTSHLVAELFLFCYVIRIRVLLPRLLFLLCRCGTMQHVFFFIFYAWLRIQWKSLLALAVFGLLLRLMMFIRLGWQLVCTFSLHSVFVACRPNCLRLAVVCAYYKCLVGQTENISLVSHTGYLSMASPKMSSHPDLSFSRILFGHF